MIRRLNPEDHAIINTVLPPSKIPDFKEKYLSNLKTWIAFGLFNDDNQLTGISCTHYSAEFPQWCLLHQWCDDPNDLKNLVDYVCKKFESYQLYKFNWINYDYSIDYLKNFIPARYITVTEYYTSPLLKPNFPKHYGTLYDSQWSLVKTEVYLSILPEELRTFNENHK